MTNNSVNGANAKKDRFKNVVYTDFSASTELFDTSYTLQSIYIYKNKSIIYCY